MLDTLTLETFTPLAGESFTIPLEGGDALELRLSAVDALSEATGAGGRAPFALLFHGAGDVVLPQAVYRLEHDELPGLELFLVPLGPDQQGMRYEAIFT